VYCPCFPTAHTTTAPRPCAHVRPQPWQPLGPCTHLVRGHARLHGPARRGVQDAVFVPAGGACCACCVLRAACCVLRAACWCCVLVLLWWSGAVGKEARPTTRLHACLTTHMLHPRAGQANRPATRPGEARQVGVRDVPGGEDGWHVGTRARGPHSAPPLRKIPTHPPWPTPRCSPQCPYTPTSTPRHTPSCRPIPQKARFWETIATMVNRPKVLGTFEEEVEDGGCALGVSGAPLKGLVRQGVAVRVGPGAAGRPRRPRTRAGPKSRRAARAEVRMLEARGCTFGADPTVWPWQRGERAMAPSGGPRSWNDCFQVGPFWSPIWKAPFGNVAVPTGAGCRAGWECGPRAWCMLCCIHDLVHQLVTQAALPQFPEPFNPPPWSAQQPNRLCLPATGPQHLPSLRYLPSLRNRQHLPPPPPLAPAPTTVPWSGRANTSPHTASLYIQEEGISHARRWAGPTEPITPHRGRAPPGQPSKPAVLRRPP
jgi:hypothetical protein